MRENKKLEFGPNDDNKISQKDAGLLLFVGSELTEQYVAAYEQLEKEAKQEARQVDFTAIDERFEKEFAAITKSAKKKRRVKRIRQLATAVVAIIVALTITFCGLMKYSIAFRATVHDWFTVEEKQAVSIDFGTGGSIPSDWAGKYAPTAIPKGFNIVSAPVVDHVYMINYQNQAGGRIEIAFAKGGGGVSQDNEEGTAQEISVKGNLGVVFEKNGGNNIRWLIKEDEIFVKLYTNLSAEKALEIANSIVLVQ